MTTKVYSYCSSSSYSNINGEEKFESFEAENNNGKKSFKQSKTENGITTTKYYGDKFLKQASSKKKKLLK